MIFLLLFLSSCCAQQPMTVVERDSTTTTAIYKYVPAPDSLLLAAQLRCDSLGRVYIEHLSQLASENIGLQLSLDSAGLLAQQIVATHDTIYLPQHHTTVRTATTTAIPAAQPRRNRTAALLLIAAIAAAAAILRSIKPR